MDTGQSEGPHIKIYTPRWVLWCKYWLYIRWFREPRYIRQIRRYYSKPMDVVTFLNSISGKGESK